MNDHNASIMANLPECPGRTKINPSTVDGELACSRRACPGYTEYPSERLQQVVARCAPMAFEFHRKGWIPCYPGMQRLCDSYKAKMYEAQREVCKLSLECVEKEDETMAMRRIARRRDWDCFEEGGDNE